MHPRDPTPADRPADPTRTAPGPRGPRLASALRLPPGNVDLRGRALGGYVVVRQIARGGMGAVFEAVPAAGGPAVALKVHLAGAAASDTQRRRFAREAQLDPAGNRGLRLAHRREAAPHDQGWVQLASSDASEPDRRPRLVLRYRGAAPGAPVDEVALGEARRERAARWLEQAAVLAPGEEALRAASQACLEAPRWGEAFLARGRVAAALRWSEAEADFARALAAPLPARAEAVHRARGSLRLALGEAREALEDAARLRALEPDGVDGLLLEGWARLALGDAAGAQQVAREALERAPDDARLHELARRAGLR